MRHPEALRSLFDRVQRAATTIGVVGVIALIVGASFSTEQFLQSYLIAYVFWLDFALGCFAIFMLHHLVSGGWGFLIQRLVEAGMRTLPFMALLFLPILLGLGRLYPWSHPGAGAEEHLWTGYLNVPFFVGRTVFYFALWIGAAQILTGWSRKQDRTGDRTLTRNIRLLSAPGLILYVLTMTFASVDWVMSLEPGWSSTIYGFLFVVSQVLASLALAVVSVHVLAQYSPISRILTERHVHHLGNLLLTFVILWAYMAYSQFIIIWAGNLPDENTWYIRRFAPGWAALGVVIVVAHFFVPFFILLFRRMKQSIRPLATVAAGIIVMRLLDTFWIVTPAFSPARFRLRWLDIVAPIALGGLWIAFYVSRLKSGSLIPLHDPRFTVPTDIVEVEQ